MTTLASARNPRSLPASKAASALEMTRSEPSIRSAFTTYGLSPIHSFRVAFAAVRSFAYAKDLTAAKATLKEWIGDKPYVVKALRIDGSDLVISSADAALLAGKDLGFLADAKVVILTD